jgi:Type IV secretory pathway, VirB3-like protein
MSNIYPEKATLFLALTRPAMILGVSVEYMFFSYFNESTGIFFDWRCLLCAGTYYFLLGLSFNRDYYEATASTTETAKQNFGAGIL